MAKYRTKLPQLGDTLFLTDGGLETTFVFLDGLELPYFAAFDLMKSAEGLAHMRRYFERYAAMAKQANLGFVLESPTWRANPDWAAKLGYSKQSLADMNRRAIDLMVEVRAAYETSRSPMPISGNIGPRGDGYKPEHMMSAKDAEAYHG